MKNLSLFFMLFNFLSVAFNGQNTSTGNPKDFKVKTCLYSVNYGRMWCGQTSFTVDKFLMKAKGLGFDGVMFVLQNHHDIVFHHKPFPVVTSLVRIQLIRLYNVFELHHYTKRTYIKRDMGPSLL